MPRGANLILLASSFEGKQHDYRYKCCVVVRDHLGPGCRYCRFGCSRDTSGPIQPDKHIWTGPRHYPLARDEYRQRQEHRDGASNSGSHKSGEKLMAAEAPAITLPAEASAFLLALAAGKYDEEIAVVQSALGKIAAIWPPAAAISQGISVFLLVNRETAPTGGVVPDGQGGFTPANNSRYDPRTGVFVDKNLLGF